MLNGYKTYLTAAFMVAYAIGGVTYGYIDANTVAEVILAAAALTGIGHKLDKNTTPSKPVEEKK